MANIKLGPVPIRVDCHDDVINANAYMEFQTTANVLSYYEVATENNCGFKEGQKITDFCFGVDTAKQLKRFFKELEYRVELQP